MNRKEIENILKDYHWMINSIKELRKSLQSAGEGLTAQYGVEATLPKPQGVTGDPIYKELIRREKRHAVINKYKAKISVIQDRLHLIKDDRELEVLHWLLEGKSYRWIGMHMGLSFSHIKRIRDSIVDKLADETNGTNGTKETELQKHKSAC
ncbi:helix-turn-helix transcriptional regulator [Heyndrickxia oleronia]|uniref:DNA-binding response regulator n=1 Tax=Heyndrickxia oleronia TaxID=38875 RepID=A0AAW6SWI8_9BACI|nr:DNA-binding response regulator [Heyndrickxia oleronia]MDH5160356.1 DNA-binding response regulator [Heyndrickxia oleronia]